MYEQSKTYLTCHLAGFTHWDGVKVFEELRVGTPLSLKAEPDNPFDPNSIAVYFEEYKLGYIPKHHNSELAVFFAANYKDLFEAFINRVSDDAHPENQIGIVVKVRPAQ